MFSSSIHITSYNPECCAQCGNVSGWKSAGMVQIWRSRRRFADDGAWKMVFLLEMTSFVCHVSSWLIVISHNFPPKKHDVLWSIFPKPPCTCQFGGFPPYPSIWTHHDTAVLRLEVADQSPAAHRPGLGLLHCTNLWVATIRRFGGTKRATPQGMGSIPRGC